MKSDKPPAFELEEEADDDEAAEDESAKAAFDAYKADPTYANFREAVLALTE